MIQKQMNEATSNKSLVMFLGIIFFGLRINSETPRIEPGAVG